MIETKLCICLLGFILGMLIEYLIIRGACAGHLHINVRSETVNGRYLFEFTTPIEKLAVHKRVYFETDFNFPTDISQKIH